MDVYQRKDARGNLLSRYWYYDLTINGKRQRRSTKRTNKADARRVMHSEYTRLQDIRQLGEKPDISLEDAFGRLLKATKGSTRDFYTSMMRRSLGLGKWEGSEDHHHLDPKGYLSALRTNDIEDLKDARLEEELSANTINGELRTLTRVINLSRKRYATNPALEIDKLSPFVRKRHFSEDEEAAILACLMDKGLAYDKAANFFVFLLETGLRRNEAVNLKWPDVNMVRRELVVWRTKTRQEATVPLTTTALSVLQRHHNYPAPFPAMSRSIRLLRAAIRETCNTDPRMVEERGRAVIHSTRDTFVTRLARDGMSLRKIGALVSHGSIETTSKYEHLRDLDVMDEARELMEKRRA